jgi:hypothetical protein
MEKLALGWQAARLAALLYIVAVLFSGGRWLPSALRSPVLRIAIVLAIAALAFGDPVLALLCAAALAITVVRMDGWALTPLSGSEGFMSGVYPFESRFTEGEASKQEVQRRLADVQSNTLAGSTQLPCEGTLPASPGAQPTPEQLVAAQDNSAPGRGHGETPSQYQDRADVQGLSDPVPGYDHNYAEPAPAPVAYSA